jgi:acid phosphatase class B
MTTHWLFRVGEGKNFINSSKNNIWGIQSTTSCSKNFMITAKQGDQLWFIQSKSNGKIIAVATYVSHNKRQLGPLINISMTDDENGWTNDDSNWINSDTEIHYIDMYNVQKCDMLTHIKGSITIRKYNTKCRVNLAIEYNNIVKYSKITFKF